MSSGKEGCRVVDLEEQERRRSAGSREERRVVLGCRKDVLELDGEEGERTWELELELCNRSCIEVVLKLY